MKKECLPVQQLAQLSKVYADFGEANRRPYRIFGLHDDWRSQICGICRIVRFVLGEDGGEDVCCDLKEENIEPIEDTKDGEFTHEEADDFVDRLKIYHIGFLVMPRTQMERIMKINVSSTPPFLLKAYRGETLYNTKMKKNSAFLAAKQIRGSQQQLFDLIDRGKLVIDDLQHMNKSQLDHIMNQSGFDSVDIKSTKGINIKEKSYSRFI